MTSEEEFAEVGFDDLPLWTRAKKEGKAVLLLGLPLSLSLFVDMLTFSIAIIFLGQMGAQSLASGTLAFSLANTAGWAPAIGLLSGLETLGSFAWGSQDIPRLAAVTHRSLALVTIFCIPLSLLWAFSDRLLVLLRQDPEIARISAELLRLLIPGFFIAMVTETIALHQQAMNIVIPALSVMIVSLPVEAALLWCTTWVFELGYRGASIALTILMAAQLVWLIAYTCGREEIRRAWQPFSFRATFSKWGELLKLSVSGAVMIVLEDFGLDVLIIFAGWLGEIPLAIHSAMIETYVLGYMMCLGISEAVTTRVGNLLGARQIPRAKLSFRIAVIICLTFEVVFSGVLFFGRSLFARAFCSDKRVIVEYMRIVPIVCVISLVDGIHIAVSGALVGLGKPHLGMGGNFASFYLVGIPLGLLFTFKLGLGILGLWMGFGISVIGAAIFFLAVVQCSDWQEAANSLSDEGSKPTTRRRVPLENVRINTPAVRYLIP